MLVSKLQPFFKLLGSIESKILNSDIEKLKIEKPIYITSLARSGTTIITELLYEHIDTCSHTYGDFPGVFTPYWNNWLRHKKKFLVAKKIERSHLDRILINNESPDAFEEVLWMYFQPSLYYPNKVLKPTKTLSTEFQNYYKNHIKKHLLVKAKQRYLSKGNYNVNRIKEILNLFPDAKFIIPIRHPVNHIASLMKQHKIYLDAGARDARINKQLKASGHFEFGKIRKIIEFDNSNEANKILDLWNNGDEIKGWARYWNYLYRNILEQVESSTEIKKAVCFVKYEDLCINSEPTIDIILNHCQLDNSNFKQIKAKYTTRLSLPQYYQIDFNRREIEEIIQLTQEVATRFNYDINNYN
jgi:hypothetical protein